MIQVTVNGIAYIAPMILKQIRIRCPTTVLFAESTLVTKGIEKTIYAPFA